VETREHNKAGNGFTISRTERNYRALLEEAPAALILVNANGQIVLLNAQTERQFCYRRDELLGQPVGTIIPDGLQNIVCVHQSRRESKSIARR
jgi:protein-histidine pros-kinase